ncbi:pyridoxamine 5'-phosphate oxidase family protein [Nocardia macrotermitis]|uniref:pyridoxamine 5'-phosphate oxidase family protein n=1 Tax=Nocardia macrotermitis TaxID=2585198 RepID=UPI0029E8064A|nr:pyridoxamine 5'-phosphate oxidase family protein [Nocardia macrotermitis]
MVDLDRAEAMRLLAQAACGRVVFTRDALPAIRPVRHIVRDDRIIVLVRLISRTTDVVCARDRVVVAYEADDLDPHGRSGWAVVVTGPAHPITDPDLIARYEPMLRSGLDRAGDVVVAIEPTIVSGIALRGGY